MTTMITGAGLVGTSFAQHAVRRGEKVVFVDPIPREDFIRSKLGNSDFTYLNEDVRSLPGLITTINQHGVDTILNTASVIGKKVNQPLHFGYSLNVGGTQAVADAARLTGVKRVVHISTFGAYDWRKITQGPVREDNLLGTGTAYSNSKVAQEMIIEAYGLEAGFDVFMLRLGNVFGVGHFWGGSGGGQKVQDLVMAGITGEPAKIPEEQTMDFVYLYAKDCGRAIDICSTITPPTENVFNIAYPFVTSFDELVTLIKDQLPDLRVEIVSGTPPVNRAEPLDIARAKEMLEWEPEFPMEDAFADYIADLRTQLG
ncbi:MAG: NAD(P)-dependent oxidoreductase [Pseudomonadota bacterium]|nr:NAD(P)-dependent oxidoreductase [Pseudomonadota bacterium]